MYHHPNGIALSVEQVTKAFHTGSSLLAWWPFRRPKVGENGKGSAHGAARSDTSSAAAGGSPADAPALDLSLESKADTQHALSHREAAQSAVEGAASSGGKKRVVAVDNVSFEVRRGEIFGILGPNGSGKSTLIRCISTLLVSDSGKITVFGLDTDRDEMAVKRLINRVSVDAAFFKKLSPMENLIYAARLYSVPARQARADALRILKRLDIRKDAITQPLEEMSRGMQQKVAIARALLTAPILLLLDEPTTGLDPRSKREVQSFVQELQATHDTTILLTTHDMHEAEALCSRIAILDEGKIVALGTPTELKARVPGVDGRETTLEDVFMALTGKALQTQEDEAAEAEAEAEGAK